MRLITWSFEFLFLIILGTPKTLKRKTAAESAADESLIIEKNHNHYYVGQCCYFNLILI